MATSSSNGHANDSARVAADPPPKKNRPRATRLRQQQLPAWQPILTSTTVIPTIFVIGVLFIPIGVFLYLASSSVDEISSYYDECPIGKLCVSKFTLNRTFAGNVYFYYGLENFFQNHRRYMKSRNDKQLRGDLKSVGDCEPYAKVGEKIIAPCGAIANSMFNDTFLLTYNGVPNRTMDRIVPWTYEGIYWDVDATTKFKNPHVPDGDSLCGVFNRDTVKPPNWLRSPCDLDKENAANNGFQNADFMVWMRTAALPDFRKPYRILIRNTDPLFAEGLPAGQYTLTIQNNFPVSSFLGKKSFIVSTTSWAGGKNNFLGVAYITVGVICIVLSAIFLAIHKKFGHYLSEMTLPLR